MPDEKKENAQNTPASRNTQAITGNREPADHEVRIAQPLAPPGPVGDKDFEPHDPLKEGREKGYLGWVPEEQDNEKFTVQGVAEATRKVNRQ